MVEDFKVVEDSRLRTTHFHPAALGRFRVLHPRSGQLLQALWRKWITMGIDSWSSESACESIERSWKLFLVSDSILRNNTIYKQSSEGTSSLCSILSPVIKMIYGIMILGNTTDDDDDDLNLVPYRSITPCADPLQTQQTPYSTRDSPLSTDPKNLLPH